MKKTVSLEEIVKWAEEIRRNDKTIVFTNGCFDIVHAGHIKSFKEAKAFGDYLIVGVNSDESIKKLKGPKRPIVDENNRVFLLESIEYIDKLIIFKEPTTDVLLSLIKPDVYVKGGDWKNKDLPERNTIETYGGKIEYIDLINDLSTTNIIGKILDAYS